MVATKVKLKKRTCAHYVRTKRERKDDFLDKYDSEPVKVGRKRSFLPDESYLQESSASLDDLSVLPIDEDELTASVCRDSFYEFVKEFWSEVSAEVPVWNWHIKYICDMLQTAAYRVQAGLEHEGDIIINIPPGTTKSTIISEMFPAWVWTFFGSARFMCISHTFSLSVDLARFSRDIIQSRKYRKLFPGLRIREDVNRQAMFLNNQKGFRFSTCSLGSVIGKHFHFVIIDDPIDPQAALSETEMQNINRFLSETVDVRKVNKLSTLTILVMQRLHEDDCTADKLNRDPFTRKYVLPADINDPDVADLVHPPELKKYYTNGLLDPIRLSLKALAQYRAKGSLFFSGQFDQNPAPVGGGMFQVDRIKVFDAIPSEWKKLIRFWDKAATHQGGAYSVGLLMGRDLNDRFWILDVVRDQWDSGTRERYIEATAELDGRKIIVGLEQEGGSGGKESVENTTRRLSGYIVQSVAPKGDKVLRADPLSSCVNGGNLYMKKSAWNKVFTDEMKHFPQSKYKDQVDAASGAYSLLTKQTYQCGTLARKKAGAQPSRHLGTPSNVSIGASRMLFLRNGVTGSSMR